MSDTDNSGAVFGGGWDVDNPDASVAVTVSVVLTQRQAMALAQLAKRAHSTSFVQLASSTAEATVMAEAVYGPLREGLAAAGFDPR